MVFGLCGTGTCARDKRERKEWLDGLFARNPVELFPPVRVFVPVWKNADELECVLRVEEEDIPHSTFVDGEKPRGEVIEPFSVDPGQYIAASPSFLEHQSKQLKFRAQQFRRASRTQTRA